ncbi:MAG: NADH:ubiquinone reductase (Na(+)-transporting) subunit F [Acidobacteriota bacterium]|nr:NADH:ubiquinone reductase (Na(+)-transporting) subunit F [Acidobacteriota bacterium]
MASSTPILSDTPIDFDYSLTGVNSRLSVERGLAEADWYQCPVERETMRGLLERHDSPAIRDTILWFALIVASALFTFALWGSWWAVLPYMVFAVLYASTSDSRWHESGHGTAFRTDWMNDALYEIASFMVMRESTVWRWSHNRHHSDTIIVGRDPEIAVPKPPDVAGIILSFFNVQVYRKYFSRIVLHALGRMADEEKTFIPESEFPKVYLRGRIYILIYLSVIATAALSRSILPLMFVGFSNFFGTWLLVTYGLTQHAGLAENVLDHRLNCRTVYMGRIHRYLYWNMNYHVEHHMFPLVPYHALPRLHALIRDDCPEPYTSLFAAWREIAPTILRQVKDPAYHVKRRLPAPKHRKASQAHASDAAPNAEGWVEIGEDSLLKASDALRFDHARKTYAVYRDMHGQLYATDGVCTHGNTHLSEGLVIENMIECPKHNGRFRLADGSPARAPICRGLATYPVEVTGGRIRINVMRPGGSGARPQRAYSFRVISNRSVATFIKELVLEPFDVDGEVEFTPGDYLQFNIPPYDEIRFCNFAIPEPFATVWKSQHVFDHVAMNPGPARRNNYSIASNPTMERRLRFNIRIATPPSGQDCLPGVGSSYMFSLKPGDTVTAVGPYGDFHIRPTQREMVYIGGGAGMAPLRSHLSHLLETEHTARKISFWYGARSGQEVYYDDYFRDLAQANTNFRFELALSTPLAVDAWTGHVGLIHQVVLDRYLLDHPDPSAVEYYLCGPPMMIAACTKMLASIGVPSHQISYDEF